MTTDQLLLFVLFVLLFAFLIWGRFRYDLVALTALVIAFLLGLVPVEEVFTGFGHPAVIIVALVLIISRGLSRSGAIGLLTRQLLATSRGIQAHIGIMATIAAFLSTVMNNVAALALLMPVDIQAAKKAKRSPAVSLMAVSFASILGGMATLIGTPPNIIIATFREDMLGSPYRMLDFAPVGAVVAGVGVLYVALIGWRLIPAERRKHDTPRELANMEGYLAEASVKDGSRIVGKTLRALEPDAEEIDVVLLGLVRGGKRLPGTAQNEPVRQGDLVVLQGSPEAIDEFLGATGLEFVDKDGDLGGPASEAVAVMEVVVPVGARIEGRSALEVGLLSRQGVKLLGISRKGRRIRARVREARVNAGDILLLLGPEDRLPDVIAWLGCLPLAERGLLITQRHKAWTAVGVFAAAIIAASLSLVYLPIALALVVVVYVALNIVPLSEIYDAVEWPVIVLLASLIPIGAAFEASGSTQLIANALIGLTEGMPVVVVLTLLMALTMTLSDVLNNVATALITAPIGFEIATKLGVNPDPFLMAVAVGASCAFLTPIGHKNNTLIMGPGGYRFGDYWRMGLPLEILVLVVSVPMILIVWPL